MIRCWKRKLSVQVLRGVSWAALVSKSQRKQPSQDSGKGRFSCQVTVPRTCSDHLTDHQQQGPRCLGKHKIILYAVRYRSLNRLLSSHTKNGGGDDASEGQGGPAVPFSSLPAKDQQDSFPLLANRRKRAWERSLSPLERMSQMVAEEFISPEIRAMRSANTEELGQDKICVMEQGTSTSTRFDPESQQDQNLLPNLLNMTSKNVPFQVGDLIVAEIRRKRYLEFKRMCKLTSSGVLNSNWGKINHAEIIGKLPGQMFWTSTGHTFLMKRPTLEEYVLMMKRGPTISYPKDINTMLLLMDINQGDIVLEAGSGSGGMSLFLSRAVGSQGRVISYEIRKDHHKVAKKNYRNWYDAWEIGHGAEWPDNVDFINKDILTAATDLKTVTFDAIALDMMSPHSALPLIFPSLKEGGICAVYLAKIAEVTHRDWLVLPATWKNGSIFQNMASKQNVDDEPTWPSDNHDVPVEDSEDDASYDKSKLPYIARPYPWQIGHTAFLVKLRKFIPAYPSTASNGN